MWMLVASQVKGGLHMMPGLRWHYCWASMSMPSHRGPLCHSFTKDSLGQDWACSVSALPPCLRTELARIQNPGEYILKSSTPKHLLHSLQSVLYLTKTVIAAVFKMEKWSLQDFFLVIIKSFIKAIEMSQLKWRIAVYALALNKGNISLRRHGS